jgi:ActR/RegA family two-component response regulator
MMSAAKVLLVHDDESVCKSLAEVLDQSGFAVTRPTNVVEALKRISSEPYDALLTDLHISRPREGLTLVSALKHANPSAVTLLLSAFPQLEPAAQAILLKADEILARPTDTASLVDVITHRVAIGPTRNREIKSVGAILDGTTEAAIEEWYGLVLMDSLLMSVPMTCEHRCGHLPQLFRDLVVRLGSSAPNCSKESLSGHAALHGVNRRKWGYTAAMLVEESRLLQVSIFHTLHTNRADIDFDLLLIGVATIADEVDSQLRQAMESFNTGSGPKGRLAWAPVRPV